MKLIDDSVVRLRARVMGRGVAKAITRHLSLKNYVLFIETLTLLTKVMPFL